MYFMFKKLSLLFFLWLFVTSLNAQMINDFESGFASLPLNSAVYKNQNTQSFSIFQCNVGIGVGTIFTPTNIINDNTVKASLVTAVNEPLLNTAGIQFLCVGPNGGNYALRLNNLGGGQDITSYTQTFMPISNT